MGWSMVIGQPGMAKCHVHTCYTFEVTCYSFTNTKIKIYCLFFNSCNILEASVDPCPSHTSNNLKKRVNFEAIFYLAPRVSLFYIARHHRLKNFKSVLVSMSSFFCTLEVPTKVHFPFSRVQRTPW
jgi:hypothetical protein